MRGNELHLTPCTLDHVVTYLQRALTVPEEFIVLTPSTPLNGVRFLQCTVVPEGIWVELSVQQGEGWTLAHKVYRDANAVEQIFQDFFEAGSLPLLNDFECSDT